MTSISPETNTSVNNAAAFNTSPFIDIGTPVWFRQQARKIIAQYNINDMSGTQMYGNQWVGDNNVLTPLETMARNYSYYLGTQRNNDYFYSNVDENNKPLNTVWIPGQTVKKLINFMYGMGEIMINNIRISTRAISKDAVNRKTKVIDSVRLKFSMKKEFDALAQAGVEFNPIGDADKDFDGLDDVENWGKNYQDTAEYFASLLAKDVYFRNHLDEKARIALLHTLITGICGFHTYAYKGRVVTDLVHPMQLIWDRSDQFDPYNRQGRYAGVYNYYTPTQILSRWQDQLTSDEIKEIKSLTWQNVSSVLQDAFVPNFNWWQRQAGGPDVQLAVTTLYFKGPRDLREKKAEKPNKYGKQPIMSLNDPGISGDYVDNCTYECTFIGGRYLVDYGVAKNQVKDTYNPSDSELPIKVFIPQIVMGQESSITGQLIQNQDRYDFVNNELVKTLNRNLGRVHIINGAMLGNKTSIQLLNDFRRLGLTVANLADGEELDYEDKRPMVTPIDMSLDPAIKELIALRDYEEKLMMSIVNVSEIALGQQGQFVSGQVQAASVSQGNLGTSYIFNGLIKHLAQVVNHAANVSKIINTIEPESEIPVVGSSGTEFLRITKDLRWEDFLIDIQIVDMIDPSAKAQIMSAVQGLAQNLALTALDVIKIQEATSYTELRVYFEKQIKQQKKDSERAAQLQAMQAESAAAQQGQIQHSLEQARQTGNNERTAATLEAQLAGKAFETAAGQQEAPTQA